ncbi:hypothetical protein [Blastococcus tunisiensis]|nr:hypothetical protein [Blastococcus sp. DSM 46838]
MDLVAANSLPDPFHGEGPQALADGASRVTWGAVVFTIGCYIWRAARRRGGRDRLGRALIIAGYVLLGVGLDRTLHSVVGIWAVPTDEGTDVLVEAMLNFLGWGVPAAFLVWLGVDLADEEVIMTASFEARRG